ncbi:putative lipase/esterase [Polymorphobacter glacialis]|uniref:Lipase/esterase n=1 Tax=Sandarakinorhabdus glacialis TaxID=1614636 RepID=A0A916ZT52_9SPHN|nr:alpha/beta hydrolase [Polymorphobacter glacialis]GGE11321.1 putative lipase/esterase [Polymorphobacter glacialis]
MTLDPVIAQILAIGGPDPDYDTLTPEQAREAMNLRVAPLLTAAPPFADVTELSCPGLGGPIALRLLRPDTPGPHPVVLFLHGGGWVVCDLDTHQPLAAALARGSGAAVLMVDYRLAPEHPFPAAIDDCSAALDWLRAEGGAHGLDTSRIVVAGDSAGGNLAAVLARRARDGGDPPLAGQYLIYPVIDLPDPQQYHSYSDNDRYGLSTAAMAWYWSNYAGTAAPGPDAIPMLATDLTGLAPALVQTAQYDVLRDEGEAYAVRLAAAGVPVSVARHPGMIHGFLSLADMVPGAAAALVQGCTWLRTRLA